MWRRRRVLVGIMLIPYSVTQGYSTLLTRLSDTALVELDRLMRSLSGESPAVQREALMDLLPELGGQYESAVGEVSAQFSAELMEMQEVRRPVAPVVPELSPAKSWHALAGWGARGSVFEQGGMLLAYSLVSGGLTKRLTEFAADTMIGNASLQSEPMRAQRVPSPGCCAFCGMLASRGAVYSSESAGVVGGRGVPVGQGRGRGSFGRGRGVKARGSQAIGESYHDHCRCRVVVVTEQNEAQLQADADKYYDAYRAAADRVNGGYERRVTTKKLADGRLKNTYEWIDAKGRSRSANERTADIVAAMRSDLEIK